MEADTLIFIGGRSRIALALVGALTLASCGEEKKTDPNLEFDLGRFWSNLATGSFEIESSGPGAKIRIEHQAGEVDGDYRSFSRLRSISTSGASSTILYISSYLAGSQRIVKRTYDFIEDRNDYTIWVDDDKFYPIPKAGSLKQYGDYTTMAEFIRYDGLDSKTGDEFDGRTRWRLVSADDKEKVQFCAREETRASVSEAWEFTQRDLRECWLIEKTGKIIGYQNQLGPQGLIYTIEE